MKKPIAPVRHVAQPPAVLILEHFVEANGLDGFGRCSHTLLLPNISFPLLQAMIGVHTQTWTDEQ